MSVILDEPLTQPVPGITITHDDRPDRDYREPGDHERFAHYVNGKKLVDSAVFGIQLEALCGKRWIPSRDPKKFPVCPECQDLYDHAPETPQEPGDSQ